jgi:IclR family transcriptional regulator, pca regulon regulatory protein
MAPEPGEGVATTGRDTGYVQSFARGLAVIRALSEQEPQTLSDVARTTGLTRATARRFLLTLERLHYVRQNDGRFALTPQVLELGFAYLSSLTLPEVAGPHLAHLVEQVHESSSVSILDGDEVVYVARVPTRRIMTVAISVGTRFPAHATSMGRVLLAGLGADQREQVISRIAFAQITPATIARGVELNAELDRVAHAGYALVDQELELGLRSIAAPIRSNSGEVIAAVNLSVHAGTMTPEEMRRRLLPPLQETAAAISRELTLASGAAGRREFDR